jgi:transposase
MQPYSLDLRVRVLADFDRGLSAPQAAEKYSVSRAWVYRLVQRRRQTGQITPHQAGNPRPKALDAHADRIRQAVALKPDATLRELRDALGLSVSLAELCRALQRLKLTLKKKSKGPPSKTGPT